LFKRVSTSAVTRCGLGVVFGRERLAERGDGDGLLQTAPDFAADIVQAVIIAPSRFIRTLLANLRSQSFAAPRHGVFDLYAMVSRGMYDSP